MWHVPDHLWEQIRPILDEPEPRKALGRPRTDRRLILDGILFRLRTGCQWNHIPPVYGSDTTLHRYFLRWTRSGIFDRVWDLLVQECADLRQIQWTKPNGGESDRPPSPPGVVPS